MQVGDTATGCLEHPVGSLAGPEAEHEWEGASHRGWILIFVLGES